jgi:hypothetical protein
LWGCSHASAQGLYTPLQPAMSGQWADYEASGEGFSLVIRDTPNGGRMVFGEYFAGRSCDECPPVWLWFQGTPTYGQTELTLYATNAQTGDPSASPGASPAGSIVLTPLTCGGILAFIDVGPPPIVVRHLTPVVYELGAGRCYTCAAPDVSPAPPGCGF